MNSQVISERKPPRLRVGLKDVNHEEFARAVREKLGKQRVSIMLDSAVIAFLKQRPEGIGDIKPSSIRLCMTPCEERKLKQPCAV